MGVEFTREDATRIGRAVVGYERQMQNDPWLGGTPPQAAAPFAKRWGKLDTQLNAGGSATVSLWEGSNGEWNRYAQDSGENVTAYAPAIMTSGSLAASTFVLVECWGDLWYVMKRACP